MEKQIKVLGFMVLHYSGDYLREALESVVDHVDKMVIAYSRQPSQGHGSQMRNPDTEGEAFHICQDVLKDKFIWNVEDRYGAENEHRNVKYLYSDGFDLCLTVDADEVYKSDELQSAFEYAMNGEAQLYGIDGYLNFWKSFNNICEDGYRPIRIENLHRSNGIQDLNCKCTIYHFSTCQREEIMRYKMHCFGHAHEVRRNWIDEVYLGWRPGMKWLHAVSLQIWEEAKPFDKNLLPDSLKRHRYFNLEKV